jgi:hypothetical protein
MTSRYERDIIPLNYRKWLINYLYSYPNNNWITPLIIPKKAFH